MYQVDVTIIGAGVVGLSIARSLFSGKDLDIVIVEKESRPGKGISSRSSEVIHSGIYYPDGFLKTRLCVNGSRLLYEFCKKHDVAAKKLGKLVVATKENETASIEKLFFQGIRNGVEGLRLLERNDIKKIEPNINGACALHSPSTGIIDSHCLVRRLEAIALDNSTRILYNTELTGLETVNGGYFCLVRSSSEDYRFKSRIVINAAGLDADKIPAMTGIDIDRAGYRIFKVKGEYFRIKRSKANMIHGLVYPGPDKELTGLGIHFTKNIEGEARLGPNAFYVDNLDYDVDPEHLNVFYTGASDFLPFLGINDLSPDTAGIRPKIQAKGEPAKDFIIKHENDVGMYGFINLIGIESPGLTSCLEIGDHILGILAENDLL